VLVLDSAAARAEDDEVLAAIIHRPAAWPTAHPVVLLAAYEEPVPSSVSVLLRTGTLRLLYRYCPLSALRASARLAIASLTTPPAIQGSTPGSSAAEHRSQRPRPRWTQQPVPHRSRGPRLRWPRGPFNRQPHAHLTHIRVSAAAPLLREPPPKDPPSLPTRHFHRS
jgi:hypothetical protein